MINLGIEDCAIDLNKDHSIDEIKIDSLRQRVLGDETLKSRTDDRFLSCFLRAEIYNEDSAFKEIKNYYEVRKRFSNVFKNLVPSALKDMLEMKIIGYLKNTDGEGSVMINGVVRYWDPSKVSKWDVLRGAMLIYDSLVTEDLAQVNGIIYLLDFTETNWSQLIHITPNIVYAFVCCFITNFPLRHKQIHLITDSTTIYWIAVSFVPFFPRKIRAKMHIHSSGSFEALHKMIDPKYLPADYGGGLPAFDASHCSMKLHENEKYFEESESYWTNKEED